MKKILIFLYFLLPIILFSQENQLENDSTIISEYLDSLNSFKESGDPLSLDNLYSDLSGLTSGNRYLNSEEWKGKLERLLSLHFAALSAITDTLDFSFYPDSIIIHRRIYPPCEVIIDSIPYSDIGNFSPDLIVDDSCRLAYIQKFAERDSLIEKIKYQSDIRALYENYIDEINNIFEESDESFFTPEEKNIYLESFISTYIHPSSIPFVRQDFGLD